ncbi:2-dehydropantoate 2-reductase [Metschnikowia bicuspidata var. bicuspidata NRRL YB-4993]|uniref:2-dehydropantoate 2-reductase n=1 Tax=Metschnikowia bicuspidata var. bicuspidata NRRL YB-4993 TaxID=869754 RepID=A0A1A0H9E5_9ASCO|nr:2-dehydropantoate 2-reductase [Metschnikowia bicuspidata var. bicuspidata NRRL YB-4993]OBA20615.1 2-dehydropantoate 2-reductase [Metschnikowia bicuspidata var. bicuspidata NRRL YB-4993]
MSTFIVGQGAMGSLVAHELALGQRHVPTLLMKSRKSLDVYSNNGGSITVMRPLRADSIASTVPVEAIHGLGSKLSGEESIKNLIIATKTYSTADAIQSYLPYISQDTNILFLQNGMGVVPRLKESFWPNSWEVPKLYHAISTHGAFKTSPNVVHHVGLGNLLISQLPLGDQNNKFPSYIPLDIPEIVQGLTESSHLETLYVPYAQFILKQMEKLVVNACINPLTTTLDCLNGDLLFAKNLTYTLNKIIGECIECFKKEYDIISMDSEAGVILSRDRLLSSVLSICKSTAMNSSSMREDVRRLKYTEIDAINGYIVSLGIKRKVATPANRMLLDLVRNKVAIEKAKENQALHRSFRM